MFKSQLVATIVLVACLSLGLAFAADKGNAKRGKYLWKTNCKVCHVKGAEGGVLSPSTLTQKQWNDFFDNNTKPVIMEKCKKFPEKDLKDIKQHMLDHAKDSDQPETCGG